MRGFLPKIIYRDQLEQIVFTLKQVIRLLWQSNPRFTIFIFILSAVWGLLTFPAFYLEKLILDRIVGNIGQPAVEKVIYPIVFLIIARLSIELLRNILTNLLFFFRQAASKNFHIRIELMIAKKLSELDVQTIEDPVFQDRYNKVEREAGRRAWGLMMPLTDIPNFMVGFISSVGILYFLHPAVAFGVVVISLPWVLVDRKFIRKWYEFELEIAPQHRIRGHIAHYLIRTKNFLEGRILNISDYLIKKMEDVHGNIISQELAIQRQQEIAKTLTYVPSLFFYAAVNIFLVIQTIGAKITVGSYELFLRSLLSSQQNFSGLTNSFMEIYENYVFVADLSWFLLLRSKISPKGGKPAQVKKRIQMQDVWFKYREDGAWILKGVSTAFTIGEKVAIVGENGAGKSTLIKVLTRFYDPLKGKVLADGLDIRQINHLSYQSKFAVLFQDFEDYSFSAQESIGYGDVSRVDNLSQVKEAAKKAGIHDYIESLPLKYDNPLSPHFFKGVQLSGGQWQRVGIARVLFRSKAEIIILDEPTSHVDPEAEEKIFNELLKVSSSKVLIFVSQRFSTVRRADRIVVIDKGRVVEEGTHEFLMRQKGKYARLFSLQAKGTNSRNVSKYSLMLQYLRWPNFITGNLPPQSR